MNTTGRSFYQNRYYWSLTHSEILKRQWRRKSPKFCINNYSMIKAGRNHLNCMVFFFFHLLILAHWKPALWLVSSKNNNSKKSTWEQEVIIIIYTRMDKRRCMKREKFLIPGWHTSQSNKQQFYQSPCPSGSVCNSHQGLGHRGVDHSDVLTWHF